MISGQGNQKFKKNFVCRWKPGVASALNYIEISDNKSPILIPYPSWDTNILPEEIKGSPEESSEEILEWDDQSILCFVMTDFYDINYKYFFQ